MERRHGKEAYRMTAAGKACLGLALDLKVDGNVPSMLEELVTTWFGPALAGASDISSAGRNEDMGVETDDPS